MPVRASTSSAFDCGGGCSITSGRTLAPSVVEVVDSPGTVELPCTAVVVVVLSNTRKPSVVVVVEPPPPPVVVVTWLCADPGLAITVTIVGTARAEPPTSAERRRKSLLDEGPAIGLSTGVMLATALGDVQHILLNVL
jgi:hypothetical protein